MTPHVFRTPNHRHKLVWLITDGTRTLEGKTSQTRRYLTGRWSEVYGTPAGAFRVVRGVTPRSMFCNVMTKGGVP